MTMSSLDRRQGKHEAIFDFHHPVTGASFEVFYSDRTLESFGWRIDKRLVYEAYKAVSWLVLVAPAARVCAGRYSAWSVSYELLSLSERCMGRGFGARCCLARGRQFGLPLLKPVA